LPVLERFSEWQTPEGKAKITPMREALTPEAVTSDGAAFAAWLDRQPEVDAQKRLATLGYCMTGSFAIRTAAVVPERIGVLASFHGGGLVTQDPKSPHTVLEQVKAAALIVIAQSDDDRDPEAKGELRQSAEKARIAAEIDVYPAPHGFCTLDSPVYDEAQAERAWTRLLATLKRLS
jgi:carboxymethylenebutenolidase